jgi:hypothetical protein
MHLSTYVVNYRNERNGLQLLGAKRLGIRPTADGVLYESREVGVHSHKVDLREARETTDVLCSGAGCPIGAYMRLGGSYD